MRELRTAVGSSCFLALALREGGPGEERYALARTAWGSVKYVRRGKQWRGEKGLVIWYIVDMDSFVCVCVCVCVLGRLVY